MSNDYTPSLDNLSLQYALSKDPGNGRTTEEWWAIRDAAQVEFDRAINKIRADAVRDAASGLVDWDIMYGHESETSVSKVSHANASYLMRVADDFERGGH